HPKMSAPATDGARTVTVPIANGGAPNLPWQGVLAATKSDGTRQGWLVSAADARTASQTPTPPPAAAPTPLLGSILGDDSAPSSQNPIAASLLADTKAVAAGKPFTVVIRLAIKPGWYTYWINPGDDGFPLKVNWTLPDGFSAGPVSWPIPESHVVKIGEEHL